ncbi:MAG: hypothetical protein IPK50_11815 [Fibrobacterota bacterium]|nr:hypothetical protein [Fibrobacterota bacterium]QQS07559.1 MAG: hypothetical protein IPK50_11815 [Fibrobacterota bacterium]
MILTYAKIFVVSLLLSMGAVGAQTQWTSVKEKDGIEVFRRTYPGSDFQELKAVGRIKSDVPRLVQILSDVPSQTSWIPLCVASKTLVGAAPGAMRIYRKFDNPWPFQDIDYVLDQSVSTPSVSGEVVVTFREVADAMPKQEGCGRMQEYRGSWRLVPVEGGFLEVTYILHLVPEGASMATFLNASLGKIGWDTFGALKAYAGL